MTEFEAMEEKTRAFAERLIEFETTNGNENPAQEWFRDRLTDFGFETYTWYGDPEALAEHRSFPDEIDPEVGERASVAGVFECGDPDRGPTLVFNGHMDVVPATAEHWHSDPFEPFFENGRLIGRGATDMKSQLAACVFAARTIADEATENSLDGRIVVESLAGEEEGGFGAATGTTENPYPFERDAVIVAEPTDLQAVTATEGCLMGRVSIDGRSAHAARRWEGLSVLPTFERVREAFADLETDRGERVTHPLYDRFDVPWPIVIGRLSAGAWASNVPGTLGADVRVGVAPGESIEQVERECRERLAVVGEESECEVAFERLGVQFASAEIDPDERIVRTLRDGMKANGIDRAPTGETYGADARYYIEAGVPAVVFGPGRIEQAHFPDESIEWADVITAGNVFVETAYRFLAST